MINEDDYYLVMWDMQKFEPVMWNEIYIFLKSIL